ncbi:type III secretion system cytoplasmic ring protein SctQ [Motilimonas pumila]|uniref:YscQ/HrcQ family type III secretion apparatus protein n=1 Tax=Motilimonas pumila TaxID=2303987 RepID=A0A418YE45_9GAMM|nr:type III secretion system cytoplasmic ring protein SctQ [Motilimonas pumila]RJG42791.1 YscQ/HrcQ family type III secretion apparatus protein [Motilimonas pumila]
MSLAPAEFNELEPALANFNNQVLTQDIALSLAAEIGTLSFSGLTQQSRLPSQVLAVNLNLGEQTGQCFLALENASLLLQEYFANLDLTALPHLLIEAGLEKVFAGFQSAIKEQFGQWLELVSAEVGAGEQFITANQALVSVSLSFGELTMPLWLQLAPEQVDALLRNFGQVSANSDLALSLNTELSFGRTQLNLAVVRELSPGDVIFFDQCYYQQQQVKMSVAKHPAWLAKLEQHQVTIMQPWSQGMDQINEQAEQQEPQLDLNELALDIDFAMAPQSLPLSEVQALAPGYVFDLQADPTNAIHIKVNGRTLGLGELVSIGGKLGVRLTSLTKG